MELNSVLKNSFEVDDAIDHLRSLGLFPHHDRIKSWDTRKMIDTINGADRNSYILDVGCNDSPILPMLRRLGFKNLYGCDLFLNTIMYPALMKIVHSFYKRNYKPIIETYENKIFAISIQDLEKTNFQNNMFDYITSLSVIEHGVNIQNYFKEMNRILKKGGMLLTSSDYWPNKLVNKIISKDIRKMSPNSVFSKEEIEKDVIKVAEHNGFTLTESIDFTYEDKVVHWKGGRNYTFIFFALKKE